MYRLALLGIVWLYCCSNAVASELTLPIWERNYEILKNELMLPLREKFQKETQEGINKEWKLYVAEFTENVRELKSKLDADAYHIIRDILFTATENFSYAPTLSDCEKPPNWRQAQAFIYTSLDLMGNVIAKLDNQ